MNCQTAEEKMMDLLETGAPNAALAEHVAACPPCSQQFSALRETMAMMDTMMDTWTAPEPSPWFDAKLHARLREEAAKAPEGFFERLRSRLLFNTGAMFKPAMSGALAVAMLAVAGGVGFEMLHKAQPQPTSAVVQDLQRLDNDAVALQELDQMANTPDDSSSHSL